MMPRRYYWRYKNVDVRADAEVHQYLLSKGYELLDDIEAYDDKHGLFRHEKFDKSGYYVKMGYNEGLVDSETCLAVQDKKSHKQRISNGNGAKNSWLAGLAKCSHCGYTVVFQNKSARMRKPRRYLYDHGAYKTNSCVTKRILHRYLPH
jgi:hypothetical protein